MILDADGVVTVPAGTSDPIAVSFPGEFPVRPTLIASTEGNGSGLGPVVSEVTTLGFRLRVATVRNVPTVVTWWTSIDQADRARMERDADGGSTPDEADG